MEQKRCRINLRETIDRRYLYIKHEEKGRRMRNDKKKKNYTKAHRLFTRLSRDPRKSERELREPMAPNNHRGIKIGNIETSSHGSLVFVHSSFITDPYLSFTMTLDGQFIDRLEGQRRWNQTSVIPVGNGADNNRAIKRSSQ